MMNINPIILFFCCLFISCSNDDDSTTSLNNGCPEGAQILADFINQNNDQIRIYEDGNAYFVRESGCELAGTYFDPDFYDKNYLNTDSGVVLNLGDGTYALPLRNGSVDFEGLNDNLDIFVRDISQKDRVINSFTLQSPSTPTVDDYVALRKCILDETCDFIDNRFDLTQDPIDNSNTVLKLYSIAPSPSMVTAKSSLSTTFAYFESGDDFWFEARFFIPGTLPTTLADFESSYFSEAPGPRIIFRGTRLAIENKFNEKLNFEQNEASARDFPLNQWVKIKVHLKYDINNGIVQLWQDGELLIDQIGPTIPMEIWKQDCVEFGISATAKECTLFMDDLRFSDQDF